MKDISIQILVLVAVSFVFGTLPNALAEPVYQQAELPRPPDNCELWQVVRIKDGDTIDATRGDRTEPVRYIGMDTPERGRPLATEATEYNRQLIENQTICMSVDISERDRFGRLLRYIWRESDGLFVNGELVRAGYAVAARYPPDVRYAELFVQLQREATMAKRGLWSWPRVYLPILADLGPRSPEPTLSRVKIVPETAQQTAVRSEDPDDLFLMGEVKNHSDDWITGYGVGHVEFLGENGSIIATEVVRLRVEALPPEEQDCFRVPWPRGAKQWSFRDGSRPIRESQDFVQLTEVENTLRVEPIGREPGYRAEFDATMKNHHPTAVEGGDVSFTLFGRHGNVVGCNYHWLDSLGVGEHGTTGYLTSVARAVDEPVRMRVAAFVEVK